MFCPKCGKATNVVDSRKKPEKVYRRRNCPHCSYSFSTMEVPVRLDMTPEKVVERLVERPAKVQRTKKETREKMNRLSEKKRFSQDTHELESWDVKEVL